MIQELLNKLGVAAEAYQTGSLTVKTPIDGSVIGQVVVNDLKQADSCIQQALIAFKEWRKVPAPRRGELVRIFGQILREYKNELGALVSWEAGKIAQEGLGEVQEMIDICDFAVGLSRQLYGLTIASEQ